MKELIIMKTIFTALAVSVGLLTVALPASAGYKAPGSNWVINALNNGD